MIIEDKKERACWMAALPAFAGERTATIRRNNYVLLLRDCSCCMEKQGVGWRASVDAGFLIFINKN